MYGKIDDFIYDWKKEEELTVKIFSKIGDAKLNRKVNENIRSLGRIAWHITQTMTEMLSKLTLFENDSLADKPVPVSMDEIIEVYKKYSGEMIELIKNKWTDNVLSEKVEMFGENWERGKFLSVLIFHQIHHRAQMTVVMRLLDIPVPGIYGPAKEEWPEYGMEPVE